MHLAEGRERRVDVQGLDLPLAFRRALLKPLATREVHEVKHTCPRESSTARPTIKTKTNETDIVQTSTSTLTLTLPLTLTLKSALVVLP